MQTELNQIETEALSELKAVTNPPELEALRLKYFGRKGMLTNVMKGMGALSKEERPIVGKLANEMREKVTRAFDEIGQNQAQQHREGQLVAEAVDITLPGRRPQLGKKHPITQTCDRIQVHRSSGF